MVHYLGGFFRPKADDRHFRIFSFTAGISIGYLFLYIFPHLREAADWLDDGIFLVLLLGFAMVHLVEKYFYQHADNRSLDQKLRGVHSITFMLYYLLAGCVLADQVKQDPKAGVLFAVPIAIHAAFSTASIVLNHGGFKPRRRELFLLSGAPALGVILIFIVNPPEIFHHITMSGISGILLYVFVKDFLPQRENGRPLFFILGIAVFYGIMSLLRIFHL